MLQNLAGLVDEATAALDSTNTRGRSPRLNRSSGSFCDNYLEAGEVAPVWRLRSRRCAIGDPRDAGWRSRCCCGCFAPYLPFACRRGVVVDQRRIDPSGFVAGASELDAASRIATQSAAAQAVIHVGEVRRVNPKAKRRSKVSIDTPVQRDGLRDQRRSASRWLELVRSAYLKSATSRRSPACCEVAAEPELVQIDGSSPTEVDGPRRLLETLAPDYRDLVARALAEDRGAAMSRASAIDRRGSARPRRDSREERARPRRPRHRRGDVSPMRSRGGHRSVAGADGVAVEPGRPIAEVTGDASALLTAERTALNFLQRLSGIATETRRYVDAAAGRIIVLDTRKTTPTLPRAGEIRGALRRRHQSSPAPRRWRS